jgi:hypothetical protein
MLIVSMDCRVEPGNDGQPEPTRAASPVPQAENHNISLFPARPRLKRLFEFQSGV